MVTKSQTGWRRRKYLCRFSLLDWRIMMVEENLIVGQNKMLPAEYAERLVNERILREDLLAFMPTTITKENLPCFLQALATLKRSDGDESDEKSIGDSWQWPTGGKEKAKQATRSVIQVHLDPSQHFVSVAIDHSQGSVRIAYQNSTGAEILSDINAALETYAKKLSSGSNLYTQIVDVRLKQQVEKSGAGGINTCGEWTAANLMYFAEHGVTQKFILAARPAYGVYRDRINAISAEVVANGRDQPVQVEVARKAHLNALGKHRFPTKLSSPSVTELNSLQKVLSEPDARSSIVGEDKAEISEEASGDKMTDEQFKAGVEFFMDPLLSDGVLPRGQAVFYSGGGIRIFGGGENNTSIYREFRKIKDINSQRSNLRNIHDRALSEEEKSDLSTFEGGGVRLDSGEFIPDGQCKCPVTRKIIEEKMLRPASKMFNLFLAKAIASGFRDREEILQVITENPEIETEADENLRNFNLGDSLGLDERLIEKLKDFSVERKVQLAADPRANAAFSSAEITALLEQKLAEAQNINKFLNKQIISVENTKKQQGEAIRKGRDKLMVEEEKVEELGSKISALKDEYEGAIWEANEDSLKLGNLLHQEQSKNSGLEKKIKTLSQQKDGAEEKYSEIEGRYTNLEQQKNDTEERRSVAEAKLSASKQKSKDPDYLELKAIIIRKVRTLKREEGANGNNSVLNFFTPIEKYDHKTEVLNALLECLEDKQTVDDVINICQGKRLFSKNTFGKSNTRELVDRVIDWDKRVNDQNKKVKKGEVKDAARPKMTFHGCSWS